MNNATTTQTRRYQGNYATAPEVKAAPEEHPIRTEINKHVGTYDISCVFEEDVQSAALYNHPGLIAYICTLKQGDRVICEGRGMSVLSQSNCYIGKSVKFAFNSALIDAVVRSSKFPDVFATYDGPVPSFGMQSDEYGAEAFLATQKQKDYLKELIDMNIGNDDERNELLSNLDSMSKEDASELIGQLKN